MERAFYVVVADSIHSQSLNLFEGDERSKVMLDYLHIVTVSFPNSLLVSRYEITLLHCEVTTHLVQAINEPHLHNKKTGPHIKHCAGCISQASSYVLG